MREGGENEGGAGKMREGGENEGVAGKISNRAGKMREEWGK